jgi:hypothetical protein
MQDMVREKLLIERRWHYVEHCFSSCKVSSPGCPHRNDVWLNLLDLMCCDAVAASPVRQALHDHSFDHTAKCFTYKRLSLYVNVYKDFFQRKRLLGKNGKQ